MALNTGSVFHEWTQVSELHITERVPGELTGITGVGFYMPCGTR